MKFSEEQVREIVALKESLVEQIDKHQEAMEMLEKNITTLDLFLKDSSFTKASQLGTVKESPDSQVKPEIVKKDPQNSIPIKRVNDGKIIANAYVTADQVSIVLDNEIQINADTPPFKSFFLDRINRRNEKKGFWQRQKMVKSKKNQ